MDNLLDITYTSLSNYIKVLSRLGYKSDRDVYRIFILCFIEEFLRDNTLSIYMCEEDYNTINKVLYCLFGSSCLIPYPEFAIHGNSLVQNLNVDSIRMIENQDLRFTEDEKFRLVNQ